MFKVHKESQTPKVDLEMELARKKTPILHEISPVHIKLNYA